MYLKISEHGVKIYDRYLFTGDTISLKDGQAGLFNKFFNMDSETQIKSIEKISTFQQVQHVFTAHYGFSADYREAFADFHGSN